MEAKVKTLSGSELLLTTVLFLTFPIHWMIFITASILVVVPAYSIRTLVKKLARKIHPNWGPMISTKDGIMAEDAVNANPNGVITIVLTLDGSPSLEEIQDKSYRNTILVKNKDTGKLLFPKYRQYTEKWLGYNFWKTDRNFRIENHVRYLLPDERNATMTEDELQRQLGLLTTQGFKPKHAHWELLYVKNFIPKTDRTEDHTRRNQKSLIIYRLHHGVGDGYSFLKCLLIHMCQDTLDKVLVVSEKRNGNVLIKLWNNFYQLAMIPYFLFRQLLVDIDLNAWFLRQKDLLRDSHIVFTRKIPINIIKEVRKRHTVSLTSVLYAALGGAIGKYFQRKYIGKNIPVPDIIRSFTPFPWKNHPMDNLINHWTCAVIPILTGITCPTERLKKCEEELNKVKGSSSPLSNYMTMRMVATLPGWLIGLFGQNWYSTCILSNFPGPTRFTKYMGKYIIDDIYFLTPHLRGNAGIGISIASYAEHIRFGLNFDKAIIPLRRDLDDLRRFIEEEIEILYNSYIQTEQHFPTIATEVPRNQNKHYNGIKTYSSKQA